MERLALKFLEKWIKTPNRKPLIIRGARQVGKTWLVRYFTQLAQKKLIEINFENYPSFESLFDSNDPKEILLKIGSFLGSNVDVRNSLLFLDEIQVFPQLISKLRWFAESLPELPVIAAGSLLEFVLSEHSFSMPVGRIGYMHLEPLSFEEFLLAKDHKPLYEHLQQYTLETKQPVAIHELLNKLFKEYILVGGLPASVKTWVSQRSFVDVEQVKSDILSTYRDDLAKYRGRIAFEKIDEVMMSVPKMLGQKFVYSHVNKSMQAPSVKEALSLLEKARISHRIQMSSANGVPIGAEIKEKYFKEIFLDTGLCSTALGLKVDQLDKVDDINMINRGGISEQVVGQLLRTIDPFYMEPKLYCWHRDEKGSSAEIDYIIQHNSTLVPIEVKAGSTGSLKSLHLFMGLKKLKLALRVNSNFPSITNVEIKNSMGKTVKYTMLSLPFYLVGQIPRLLTLYSK
jgi:hypothetical protein